MIKIITFWVGVDVLGFPLLHQHKLLYSETRNVIPTGRFKSALKDGEHTTLLFNRKLMQK